MAKTDNLVDFLVDLADGIRAKKGITSDINPQDFRKEIESIGDGGSTGGGSNWRYFDVSKMTEEHKKQIIPMFALIIRIMVETNDVICTPNFPGLNPTKTLAFGFDSSAPFRSDLMEGINTVGELFVGLMGDDEIFNPFGIFEITKDEFMNKTFVDVEE